MLIAQGDGPKLSSGDLEADSLRSCVNDLVGVLSLRALWAGGEPARIAEVLVQSLSAVLEPDFVYLRLVQGGGDCRQEVFRAGPSAGERLTVRAVSDVLDDWMGGALNPCIGVTSRVVEGEPVTLVAQHLGVRDEFGVVMIGARRETFPTATERLLVNVAVSQALIGLQESARLAEQRARAAELDRMVAQRTLELAVTNKMLRRSEALLSEGQRLSLTGSIAWRPDRDEITWSEQTYRLFDIEPTDGPSPDIIYSRIHPDDLCGYKSLIERAKTGAMEDHAYEFRLVRRTGDVRYMRLVWRALVEGPEDFEYLAAIQDLTERRQSEAAAAAYQTRMSEMRDELAHANRLATVGQWTAAISHDVRQPLTSVMLSGNTSLNWLAAEPPDVAAARRAIDRVINGARRAIDILDRTKSFAKKSFVRRETLTPNDIVDDTVALVGSDAHRRGITISTHLNGSIAIVADRLQVQQVVMNLVVNAIDAVATFGGEKKEVTVETWDEDGSSIVIEVRDNGPGIPEAQRERLFEAFFTTKADGMGMGLAICREIVEAHGGSLTMTPAAPHGAAFKVALPQEFEPYAASAG
ncbi:sensor histidine kinase [Sphingomonas sp. S2-65]|uniref:sensor histidine kinase n=1 Tax=Sphingomonas sp. S2-65 TaxID=2903960 RepID=UPI001F3C6CD9|nr:ATP-binding protein [Sphingomonas sp. S2-65]UYY58071.1 ATP-binding protein [Sphingomonas sp. S2-65]